MRKILSLLLMTCALPAVADTIPATSRVTAVTVYLDAAKLTREVTFSAPSAGAHELLLTDLPAQTDAGWVQMMSSDGLQVGSLNVRPDRLPPREDPLTPAQKAAKAKVKELELAEQAALLALESVQSRIDAAEVQVRFLSSLSGLPEGATPETIRMMAGMIGTETLVARQAAIAAKSELLPAHRVLQEAQEALDQARAAYDALPSVDMNYTALSIMVTTAAEGPQTVMMTQYVNGAGWRPVYDMRLTRELADELTIDRSVLVTQFTGEDWQDVALTLSTARPSMQADPTELLPELRQIVPEAQEKGYEDDRASEPGLLVESENSERKEMQGNRIMTADAALQGDMVVYNYPAKVTIASGVEDLRLALDSLSVKPEIQAVAVPRYDQTAFLVANFTNSSAEPLLPGNAQLYRDGALVGGLWFEGAAPGVKTEIGFGAIETLRIKREMPVREGGATGIFTSSKALSENVVLTVENTGSETWPVRLIDLVPYSEQTDLQIEYSANPPPTETDVDAQRGVLAWEFDLSPGAKQTVTLAHSLTWPEGMVLQ